MSPRRLRAHSRAAGLAAGAAVGVLAACTAHTATPEFDVGRELPRAFPHPLGGATSDQIASLMDAWRAETPARYRPGPPVVAFAGDVPGGRVACVLSGRNDRLAVTWWVAAVGQGAWRAIIQSDERALGQADLLLGMELQARGAHPAVAIGPSGTTSLKFLNSGKTVRPAPGSVASIAIVEDDQSAARPERVIGSLADGEHTTVLAVVSSRR